VLATSAVVPVLALVYAFANSSPGSWTEPGWSWAVAAALLVLLVAGNVLLLRYAIDIKRLRRFLAECVRGMAMTNVELTKPGDDMVRIEAYLNEVKRQSEERLAAVERQSRALIKAEQHRVMIETLGAACHHLGQPATVIRTYLELMRKRETSPELAAMITECLAASDAVSDVLVRLRQVASYRTEPYLPAGDLSAAREDARILKV
jgi:signal transduction histidine kinase